MDNKFLAINKEYFKMGLKSIDILIISQIEEFQRNRCQCYITNKQFSEMFGESEDSIKRSLTKLENLDIIKRQTTFVTGSGRSNKQRVLALKNRKEWKVQNALTIDNGGCNMHLPSAMEGANSDNGRCKNGEWKVQYAPIKDNKKNNIKDNITLRVEENQEPEIDMTRILGAYNKNKNRVLEEQENINLTIDEFQEDTSLEW